MLAHALAQEARVAVGGQSIEADPEAFPWAELVWHCLGQFADGGEVAHQCEVGPERQQRPGQVFAAAPQQLLAEIGRASCRERV